MNCEYLYDGQPYTYKELFDLLVETDLKDVSDMLFSLNDNRRKANILALDNIRINYSPREKDDSIFKQESVLTSYDVDYGTTGTLSLQLFIYSPLATVDGQPLCQTINILELRENIKQDIKREYKIAGKTISDDEVESLIDNRLSKFKIIEKDATLGHKLVTYPELYQTQEIVKAAYNAMDDDLKKRFKRIALENFADGLYNRFWKNITSKYTGLLSGSVYKGLNIEVDLEVLNKKLSGHADYIILDKNGVPHLYKFVFTSNGFSNWDRGKKEYFKLSLVTLKKMLSFNGVNTDNMSLHLIPVYMKYDENDNVEDMIVGYDKEMSITDTRRSDISKYEYKLNKFIKPKLNLRPTDEIADKMRQMYSSVWPIDLNLTEKGLDISVKEWIKNASDVDPEKNPLVISKTQLPDAWYTVYIENKAYKILSHTTPKDNKEIIQLVSEHLQQLNEYSVKQTKIMSLYGKIQEAYKNHYFKENFNASILNTISEYVRDITVDESGKITSNWELIDDLLLYNILLFKKNERVDVVYLSMSPLDTFIDFGNNNKNLLGLVKSDIASRSLAGKYGNLQTITSLLILNEYLPKLNLNEFRLGNIHVVSPVGNHNVFSYNIKRIVDKYLPEILTEIRKRNPELEINNNFNSGLFYDPINTVLNLLDVILNDPGEIGSIFSSSDMRENIEKALTDSDKQIQLKRLLDFISNNFFDGQSHYLIIQTLNGSFADTKIAQLYKLVTEAYLTYSKQDLIYGEKLSKLESNVLKPLFISSHNARLIVTNYHKTTNIIYNQVNELDKEYIRDPVMTFYKEVGYTAALNSTTGFQEKVFRNLFDKDSDGNLTMLFKNPYQNEHDSNYLSTAERKFLKRALFLFNKFLVKSNKLFVDENDPEFIKEVNNNPKMLWVPLERAASDTMFSRRGKYKSAFRNKRDILAEMKSELDEIVKEAKEINVSDTGDVFNNLHVGNKFDIDYDLRDRFIREKGPDYFETNVEDLLVDVLLETVEVEKTNDFLITTKAILFQLELMKLDYKDAGIIESELNYISDYMKVNVLKTNLTSGVERKIIGMIMPIRRFVVNANLAGNIVAFFRDIENGFLENFGRSLTKHGTNITAKDLSAAYKFVTGKALFSNPMHVNLLDQLCTVYRISNVDFAKGSERMKSGRTGLSNYENLLFFTLRAPDFLNRMVLFVARCVHDGVIDVDNPSNSALFIKDNKLVYDWKKDRRFYLLANNDKSNIEEYNKQLGIYLTLLEMYNEEHPESDITSIYDENKHLVNLLTPYTEGEIEYIKDVANNIYGDYDRSGRALADFKSLGIVFTMFTTWFNGVISNWITKPGEYGPNKKEWVWAEDAEGKLYRDPETGRPVHETDLKPEDEKVPFYVLNTSRFQGVFPTLQALYNIFREDGGKAAIKYIHENENVKTLIHKELLDALMSLIWLVLFKLIFDPKYQDHKKLAEGERILNNVMTEILYKSTRASFDTFFGPINIIKYFGDNMNPPIYQVPTTLISDLGKFVFGDKAFLSIVTGNFGFARAFRDTYSMYKRDVIQ